MFCTNHLYRFVDVGTHVIVNTRDEHGMPVSSHTGTVVGHLDLPEAFGKSLDIKTDDGRSIVAEGGNHNQEVYIG